MEGGRSKRRETVKIDTGGEIERDRVVVASYGDGRRSGETRGRSALVQK